MGVQLLEIRIKMKKAVTFTIKGCFRSVCNHPFLVVMLCFLIFMHRSFPFIFSLLVSASPILVCTAVLLGTLLSFGQPNIPEIEIEEKTTHEVVSMKTGLSRDAIVVEKNQNCYVERYSETRRDGPTSTTEEPSSSASKVGGEICREGGSHDIASLIEEKNQGTEAQNGEILEANEELGDTKKKQQSEWNEERFSDVEVMENHYASIPKANDEHVESDEEKSVADSFDSERVNVDSPPRSPWKRVKEREDEEEEEDDALDSGSDGAESSSPDASMADIMPMLDELHPLLDEDAPLPVQTSLDGSDAASEQSLDSSTSSHVSDDETEIHSEVADDDREDGEDVQGDKEEETKSAITWTEEDQKNLMDLGSSEIERNQRLENLMLRRRARKHMSMVPEMNLIDLESYDAPFHIAPISTARKNPFDLPNDSYDNSGLPPIPGSAPSILLPRRNPFDIPYDSSEEKVNIMGSRFQEELTTLQPREPFFRRHESFHVGPSIFAPNRQEKQDIKLRPYFVPERMVSEESSYLPLHRQSSELSDSKLSSVPDTESVGSVEDLEDHKLAEEEDNPREIEVISRMEEVIEECPSGDQELVSEREVSDEDVPREPELISEMKHVSEHVGHGSQSSEEEDDESSELGHVEKRDVEFDDHKFQSHDIGDHHSRPEAVEQRYSRGSSSSSLSELSDRVFKRRDGVAEEPDVSRRTSVEITNLSISSALVDEVPHKEPVYDSSPSAASKNFSSSSSYSDVHAESDTVLPPVVVKRTVSFVEREPEVLGQEVEKDIPSKVHDTTKPDFSGADQRSESQGASESTGVISHVSLSSVEASESSNDKNVGHSQEEKHLPNSKKESLTLVKTSPFQGQTEAKCSVYKEKAILSPNSDGDDYHEANEKLNVTPSARGSASHFYDIKMRDPNFDHLEEVQVPNTPVESFEKVQNIQNLNIPEIHELANDITSNMNSPVTPDFISLPSSVAEEAHSRTIIEEADEIKEMDGFLSELDSVGDFRITEWGSRSNEFEKHIDSAGMNSSSAHHPETSAAKVVEVNSVEVNKKEQTMNLENSRDEVDIREENTKCISELQTSQTQHIDVSNREFTKTDDRDSTDQRTSQEETLFKENEAKSANSVLNHSHEDVDSFPNKAELASVKTEVIVGSTQDINTDSEMQMPELEARKLEDVELVFKQLSDKEIEKPPQAEMTIGETIAEHGTLLVNTKSMDPTHETPVLEVGSVEDATSEHKQVKHNTNDGSVEVKAKELGSSVEKEPSVNEISSIAAEKPDDEVKVPKDLHSETSVKGKGKDSKRKGKASKSSSSSSSSSSKSSSSDSDRE